MPQDDRALGDFQLISQKPVQSGVRSSFNCWPTQLDLDHVATPAYYLVNLCVGNCMDANGCH